MFCLFCFTLCNVGFVFSFPFLFLYFVLVTCFLFRFSFYFLFVLFRVCVCVCFVVLLKKESRTDFEQHEEREQNCYFGLIWLKCLYKCKY